MIETLNEEQVKLMEIVKNDWLNQFFSLPKLNKKKAKESVEWLYEFSKLEKPEIVFVDSPLAIQFYLNMIQANVRANVRDNVGANVWANVGANVWANVRDNVRANVRDNVWANVGDKKSKYFDESIYGNISDYGWVSFYDFFVRIGMKYNNENFTKYIRLLKTGIYDMVQMKGLCVICGNPKKIMRDKGGKLHSDEGPCIEWKDGYKFWALSGVRFEYDLWKSIVGKTITPKEIFGLKNIEQRMATIKQYGAANMIEEAGAVLIDKSERGNELYSVDKIFSSIQYFLKYSCPSTGRVYTKFVDPKFAKDNLNADSCQAWSLGLVPSDYNIMTMES